jgi:DNA-binding IclR family transcriptional regulator
MYGYPVGTEEVLYTLVKSFKGHSRISTLAREVDMRNSRVVSILSDLKETGFVTWQPANNTMAMWRTMTHASVHATRKGRDLARMLEHMPPEIRLREGIRQPRAVREDQDAKVHGNRRKDSSGKRNG